MYLTDVLDMAAIARHKDDVPQAFIEEQAKRMQDILIWGRDMEQIHDAVFPTTPFAPGFLMYLDYLIHLNTTGTKQ